MRKRAALMSRVSSDEQTRGYSLGVQSESLENYCRRNDIEIVYSFREDHSAKSFDRPAFKKFVEWLKENKGEIDLLLFTSWDRFSRNAYDAYRVIDELKKLGVQAQSIEQPIDFSIPENKVMLAVFLAIPEVDNDRRSIKIKGGMRAALKAGRWSRNAPYGYRNARDENNRPIIVPDEYAEGIRFAYEQVARGRPQSEIVAELKKRGTPISKSQLSYLLRNPMYMGKLEVPPLGDEPYQLIEAQHEGIVDEQLFYQVQHELSQNSTKKRVSTKISDELLALRGILKCSNCGSTMTGSRSRGRAGTRYAYYHCNHCGKERYRSEKVNQIISEILNSFQFTKDERIIQQEVIKSLLNGSVVKRQKKVDKLKDTIAKQEERIERLQDNLADGIVSSEDFIQMKARFQKIRSQAEAELKTLHSDSSEKEQVIRRAVSMLSELGNTFSKASGTTKISLLGSIFPEMLEFDGNQCRTKKLNEALALCLSIDKGSRRFGKRKIHEKLDVSYLVASVGIEPTSKV